MEININTTKVTSSGLRLAKSLLLVVFSAGCVLELEVDLFFLCTEFVMRVFVILVLSVASCAGNSLAQEFREKPKELESLSRYVGDWTTIVTSKPAEWTPHEINYRCKNHAEMILDGWFLQHIEVNHVVDHPDQVSKSIWFTTVDATSNAAPRPFLRWTFQSSGLVAEDAGTWDTDSRSFVFNNLEAPPDTMGKSVERFRDAGTIDGSLVFTDTILTRGNSRKFFDMVWMRKRPMELAERPLSEEWAAIGTPIEPIPSEVKRLEAFVGHWDAEFIVHPTAGNASEQTINGTMSGQWTLDGRFVLGEAKAGDVQTKWIIGYKPDEKAYCLYVFSNLGWAIENIGHWNENEKAFAWKGVGEGLTSGTRFPADGALESHIVVRHSGRVHVDLTIKAARRK
jgi:Protein of unknown function (DUF1579)